jgi:hypothetical protein
MKETMSQGAAGSKKNEGERTADQQLQKSRQRMNDLSHLLKSTVI